MAADARPPQHDLQAADARLHRRILVAALALAAVHSLFLARAFRFNNVDDAYIAFRYGAHLVGGHGLVFNPGERVEGYTSLLWTVLLAPFTALPIDIVWFSIGLGLLAALVALVGLAALVRIEVVHHGGDVWLYAALPLVALDGTYAFWAVGGMETSLFTALVVWCTVLLEKRRSGPVPIVVGILLGLTTLARPEGAILVVVAVIHRFASRGRGAVPDVRNLVLGWLLLVVPHVVWRRVYYDAWLPNTFHNKVSLGAAALENGAAYLGRFVRWRLGVPLLAVLAIARPMSWRPVRLHVLFTLVFLAYVVAVGGDWPIANRFVTPAIPFVHLLVVQAVVGVVRRPATRAGVLAVGAAAVVAGTSLRAELHGMVRRRDNVGVETQRKRFGIWLHDRLAPGTLIAVGPAGAIPYYSRLPSVDMWGLTDAHIARAPRDGFEPGHDRSDLAYVLGRHPHVIVGAPALDPARPPAGYRLVDDRIPASVRPHETVLERIPTAR
jgi:arabinofuranosyltransferase